MGTMWSSHISEEEEDGGGSKHFFSTCSVPEYRNKDRSIPERAKLRAMGPVAKELGCASS